MDVNARIFRKYDIRGIAERDLTDDVAEAIGQAYATIFERRGASDDEPLVIGVGRDARGSSSRLFEALARGLERAGAGVVDLGMIPTPLAYFSVFEQPGIHGCIQITGSHNPAAYNGFKMMQGHATLHGEAIQAMLAHIQSGTLLVSDAAPGRRSTPRLVEDYIAWVKRDITTSERPLRVVVDSGNGVGGVAAPELVREVFGAHVIELFSEPDASFPNHHPDPTVPENLRHLIEAVRTHQADLGVAYDGDADRIGVVDERGEIIWGDRLMILLARDVLEREPGATIIGEVKCSQTLYDDIAARGGVPVMSAVGHSLIKAKIKETGAKLAGEMSGHIFFNDRFFGFDDALYTTCRVLEILQRSGASLSELMADVPETFVTPEIRRESPDDVKFTIPARVAEAYAARGFEVTTIDGARIHTEDGWALVRASNTQPKLVLRVEASSPERRDAMLAELEQILADIESEYGS